MTAQKRRARAAAVRQRAAKAGKREVVADVQVRRSGMTRRHGPPAVQIPITTMPGYLVRRLHQLSQAAFEAAVTAAGFDLTPVQFATLATIAAHPGLDQARIADAISFDRATTGGVIDRLESKGLVRRRISADDRRARQLEARREGIETLRALAPVVQHVQGLILTGLAARERAQFLELITKAIDAGGKPRETRAAHAIGRVTRPSRRR